MKTLLIGFLLCIGGIVVQAQTSDSTRYILIPQDFVQPIAKFNHPLYVLNGKKLAHDSLNILDPNSIESIHILKGLEAKEKYGDEGKNGVVVITLKEICKT